MGGRRGGTHLHAHIRVTHSAVDGERVQRGATIFFHCVKDGAGLETGCLDGCARDVFLGGVLRHSD